MPYSLLANRLELGLANRFSPFPWAKDDERMIVVVDSSEIMGKFTVSALTTQTPLVDYWYKSKFTAWNDNRRYPWERLSFKEIRNAEFHLDELYEFVKVIDLCPGFLLSLTFDSSKKFILSNASDTQDHPDLSEFREWNPKTFERLLRTCFAISLAMRPILSHPSKWTLLHDQDDLFEPRIRIQSSSYINQFVTAMRGEVPTPLELITEEQIPNNPLAKALLGIPDLIAGGMSHSLSRYREKYGIPTDAHYVGESGDLNSKSAQIALWMATNSKILHKVALSFEDEVAFLNQFDYRSIEGDKSP